LTGGGAVGIVRLIARGEPSAIVDDPNASAHAAGVWWIVTPLLALAS